MKTINFIPIDYDYFDFNGRNYAKITGRDEKGKKVTIIDTCDIYFYAILHDKVTEKEIEKIRKKIESLKVEKENRTSRVIRTELNKKNYLGKEVRAIKIFVTNLKDCHAIADQIDFKEIDKRREYDLPFTTKYILERKLKPLLWYEIEGDILNNSTEFGGIDQILNVDLCLKVEKIKPIDKIEFKPKILAYDIEADEFEIGKGEIVMISLVGENFQKVLTCKSKGSNHKFVEHYKDEADMLEAFVKYIKSYNPDILTGYFSDEFDLPYLRARAEKNHLKLALGIDNTQPIFSRGRMLVGKIKGIVHVDMLKFIKTNYSQYLNSETLSLNDVSQELLGEKKRDWEFKHSSKIKQNEWENFFDYNLQDSILTYKLLEKAWPDMQEFSRIIQEPLFDISRDGMSSHVENYIIHNLERFNEIIEKRPLNEEIGERIEREKYEGAFVFQPKPGLYENICFFDFTSYWPSIIVTFNLSKSTFLGNKKPKEKNFLEVDVSGKKFYFTKKPGFFSEMLKEIIEKRKQYKQEYNKTPNPITKARSNAFKLLANASYGYQGFFGARYYCPEASASATGISRDFTKKTINEINKEGYEVIYSDSIGGKTRVVIKEKGKIYETEIENLFEKVDQISVLNKEYDFRKDIEVLTLDEKGNSIFKPIVYVMRHNSNKKMFRVNFTNNWHIEVTEDHSLMAYQSIHHNQSKKNKENPIRRIIEIKPEEIKKKANSIITLKTIPNINCQSKKYPKEVYEFMGYFIGDGSFMRNKSHSKYNKDYYLRLSLGLDKEEVFKKLIEPLKKLGYIKSHWGSNIRKGDLTINGLKLLNIISKDFRDKNGKKIIPEWLFEESEENIASFLRGLFSADGCVIIRNNAPIIKFTSIYDNYIEQVRKLLYRVGISHSVFKENSLNKYKDKRTNKIFSSGSQSKNIILKNKEDFMDKIGFIIDRKNKLGNTRTNGIKKSKIKDFEFDLQGVKSIEQIKTPEYVYDIEVEDNHRFFANYVLVHNTDSIAFKLNKNTKRETLELLEQINKNLPGIMELDLEDFYKRGIWVTKRTGDFGEIF